MRIAILTIPLNANYGGILQAYALQTTLEKLGNHEVVVLDNPYLLKMPPKFLRPFVYAMRLVGRKLGMYHGNIKKEVAKNTYCANTYHFVNTNIHEYYINGLEDIPKDRFDAIVVGSDQIWRSYFFHLYFGEMPDAFLRFTNGWNIKRIAYAPSFGVEKWEYSEAETEECKKYIQKMDAVSCREVEGVEMCKKHLNCDTVKHVLDPTMLLTKDDYQKFVTINKEKTGKLLVYVMDPTEDKQRLIDTIASKYCLVPNSIYKSGVKSPPSVEFWLQQFEDAEFVVTDSFHACVFSIIFGKEFIVYGNKNRGLSRFTSLLRMFGLEDRLILSFDEYIDKEIVSSITESQKKLEELRIESKEWLSNALNRAEGRLIDNNDCVEF